jgi:hypothetical protein
VAQTVEEQPATADVSAEVDERAQAHRERERVERELEKVERERKELERERQKFEQLLNSQSETRESIQRWEAQITRARTLRGASVVLAAILAALAVVVQLLGTDMALTDQTGLLLTVGFGVGAALFLGGAAFMPRYLILRREEREREKELRAEVEQAAAEVQNAEDFTELVKVNTKNLSTYTALARAQAAVAFRNSQVAMAVGLLVLFVGAVATIAADGTMTKVATASLTTIGGAFAGYIARTFIRSYNAAIEQMNFAFQQPLVNSYLLGSERLARQMSTAAQRDKALECVIDKLVMIILRVVPDTSGTSTRDSKPK